MKILILAEDLRVTGTSEGIVSRSFIYKIRESFPDSIISVIHFNWSDEDELPHLLPVDDFNRKRLLIVRSGILNFLFKVCRKFFKVDIQDKINLYQMGDVLSKINPDAYDIIIGRSTGINFSLHRALIKYPKLLEKIALNFHDPYPVFFSPGCSSKLVNKHLQQLSDIIEVVDKAKLVFSPSSRLSNNLSFLYGSNKPMHTIPHQFNEKGFALNQSHKNSIKDQKHDDQNTLVVMYHGAIQLNQSIEPLLKAFIEIEAAKRFKKELIFVLRLKGNQVEKLKHKYESYPFLKFLPKLNSGASYIEQKNLADICIILDTCGINSEILVGKAPMLAELKKPVLVLTPKVSELRNIIKDEQYLAVCSDQEEIKEKLQNLILRRLDYQDDVFPFGDYFSIENFKRHFSPLLKN